MVLITGASAGIGESCAKAFAASGRNLVLLARRQARLNRLAVQLTEHHKVTVHTFGVDLTRPAELEAFFLKQETLLSQVSVLVNNAGVAKGVDAFQDGSLSDWDLMIDTNVRALLRMTRGMVSHFLKNKEGHVVNLGSVAGRWVYPKGNIYCATKFAVRALTEALRMDLAGTGIRVTEIAPGMVETEFSQVRLGDEQKAKAVYTGMTPLTADDIAEAVVWCVSRPKRVNVQELVIYSTDQASPTIVHRRN